MGGYGNCSLQQIANESVLLSRSVTEWHSQNFSGLGVRVVWKLFIGAREGSYIRRTFGGLGIGVGVEAARPRRPRTREKKARKGKSASKTSQQARQT